MRKNERGAIVVEATIALTAFIFALYTILSIVNICYIQAKMQIALNSAAKDLSQYSYLYFKFGLDEVESQWNEGTEDARVTSEQTLEGINVFLNSMSDANTNLNNGNFDEFLNNVDTGTQTIDSLVTLYGDQIADDPTQFITGMAKMAANDIKEEAKGYLAGVMGKSLMKKNLKAFPEDDAESFLKRNRVVDGLGGLDFNYSLMLPYGANEIQLVVRYDVEVIKLLNIDFKFTFQQCSKTQAWGNGISLAHPEISTTKYNESSIWDNAPVTRGKMITEEEKKKYDYVSSGKGFDAYEADSNQFVQIVSIDTHSASYQNVNGIKNQLNSKYTSLKTSMNALDETFEVENKNGTVETVTSPKDTRTCKIVLVIPDDADMEFVNQAVSEFTNGKDDVEVEIIKGYGSPTPKTENSES